MNPFPVDGTYRIRANLSPLGGRRGTESAHFIDLPDHRLPALCARLDALERGADHVAAVDLRHPDRTGRAWRAAAATIASECPDLAHLRGDRLVLPWLGIEARVDWSRMQATVAPSSPLSAPTASDPLLPHRSRALAWLSERDPTLRLVDLLALAVVEDLVIIAADPEDATDRAELLHVAFASGWSPREKLGLDFGAIHQPVADSDALRAAHPDLVRTMTQRGPFVRYVWGLSPDDALCHVPALRPPHADDPDATPDQVAESTWFRVERQTLLAVPDVARAVFTIRVDVRPLATVIDSADRAARLAASLRDMSDAVAEYKGVAQRRPRLLTWLDARAVSLG